MDKQSAKFDFVLEAKQVQAINLADFMRQIEDMKKDGYEVSNIMAMIIVRKLS